jgi:hypothetical protein
LLAPHCAVAIRACICKAEKHGGVQRWTCSRVKEENGKSCREGMHAESRKRKIGKAAEKEYIQSRRRKMGKSAREGCMQSRRRKK